ncbi:MAG: AbrB/MazE/SpoVT family DNA-binding domain-containing protein [Ruminococcaceae bacterium]|nr:AbrB/MazE/SpoVT family DNA-binding domain-containing protein [Oscillospiraceae bacterium]
MKSTGIVRPIDQLGRVVLPKELRENLGISPKDSLEVFVENEKIILKKYAPNCCFCGNDEDMNLYQGKLICKACIRKLAALAE